MAADPRFFGPPRPQSLGAIAALLGVVLPEGADGAMVFTGTATLRAATADQISFIESRRYLPALRDTAAGAVFCLPEQAALAPPHCVALAMAAPQLAFARVAALFHPVPPPRPGIHPTAVIDPTAEIGAECEIGPYAVVGEGARIGDGSLLGAHAAIGPWCVFGRGCRILTHASASHTLAGDGVVLHPGARVGQEGFGLVFTAEGRFETAPQLGRVLLGDRVEVGANACIDRGGQQDTVIGAGSRIDNLVQVAHNVTMGKGCVIVGQAGIAGSTTLGDYVTLAGQVGVAGHLNLGSKVRVGAQAGVMSDVPAGQDVLGSPAWPARDTLRAFARLRQLGQPTAKKA
ncbi:UDP-3-O-[3-hydroxymyristoyl] glucosamine N-acyltransferase [Humitalea rosea]|uniref:UDP-3-O-acylglucosamine N-acyltransferase n=1 Tax=Humitalea rosea TaxID=990373 RepID=A0A2W7IVR8_9PROT|nr:UDP-3-O-(3-hydroxymyristoyl)glucosamine N-acyltransferase [Humitalea rosea]PZW43577.1 UDP-3-O-[3-hydroxymyristoyl] glucosamine N-acyltransferase [Humitalea rosea]